MTGLAASAGTKPTTVRYALDQVVTITVMHALPYYVGKSRDSIGRPQNGSCFRVNPGVVQRIHHEKNNNLSIQGVGVGRSAKCVLSINDEPSDLREVLGSPRLPPVSYYNILAASPSRSTDAMVRYG